MGHGGTRFGAGEPKKVHRLSPRTLEGMRAKIKADSIITRLMAFFEGTALDGSTTDATKTVVLTRDKITVALALLRKVLPDMAHVELTGADSDSAQTVGTVMWLNEWEDLQRRRLEEMKQQKELLQIEGPVIDETPPDDGETLQ